MSLPLALAGSDAGPTTMKSLYITGKRLVANPSATNFSSAAVSCTNTMSASPRRPVSSAWPVPTATTRTSMPVACLNSGSRWPNRPDCSVDVVEAITMDLSCDHTGFVHANDASAPASTRAQRRTIMSTATLL